MSPKRGSVQLRVSLSVTPDPAGGARALLVAEGEIDVATVGPLHAASLAVATAAGADPRPGHLVPLVLDWEQVAFLDSSGVHLLQALHAEGIERGWAVQLIAPSAPAPRRLLGLAADRGWLPRQLSPALPAQSQRTLSP